MSTSWQFSTHRTRWLFSSCGLLSEHRLHINSLEIAAMLASYTSLHALPLPAPVPDPDRDPDRVSPDDPASVMVNPVGSASVQVAAPHAAANLQRPSPPSSSSFFTAEDALTITTYYAHKTVLVCQELQKAFYLPDHVAFTAAAYFRRFFLKNSLLEIPCQPKAIMFTCVYLACKAEERYVGAEELAKINGEDPKEILSLELHVLNGLDFDLVVHGPVWPLRGWTEALWRCLGANAPDEATQKKVYANALKEALDLWLTDAMFVSPPSVITLLALRRACEGGALAGNVASDAHLSSHGGLVTPPPTTTTSGKSDDGAPMSPAAVRSALDALHKSFPPGSGESPRTADASAADLKRRKCRNPANDPSTELYAHLRRQEDEERAEKKRVKLEKKRAKQEEDYAVLNL